MKSGEELYSKVHQSLGLPQRIALKPNLHPGRKDATDLEARASVDRVSREYGETRSFNFLSREYEETRINNIFLSRWYGKTRCGNSDFRIQGLPHSIVQQQDDTRNEAVKKLIRQFETQSVESRLGKGSIVQSIQREVERRT